MQNEIVVWGANASTNKDDNEMSEMAAAVNSDFVIDDVYEKSWLYI